MTSHRLPCTSSLGGHRVPVEGEVVFSTSTMNRDPEVFDHLLRFDPDRWLDGRTDDLPRSAYMPGSRVREVPWTSVQHADLVIGRATSAIRMSDAGKRSVRNTTPPNRCRRVQLLQRGPATAGSTTWLLVSGPASAMTK
ncbi:cytochrome P450 [Streptomyces tendae]|uniref:cytochrome P450 n=1 Tax=Streptomyces tendae TaxID=1932 RepID=UPI00368D705D